MSLEAALESAHNSIDAGAPSSPVAPAPGSSTPSTPEGQGSPVTPGAAAAPQYIGFTPDQPTTPQTPEGAAFRLAETLKPDTVVAYDGDKPITAQEVQQGYFRQSDYTRKTQEIAEQGKVNAQAIQFFEQNKADIERLYSADPSVRAQVFAELGQRFQIPAAQPAAAPTRGANGQFTPASPATPGTLNPEDWDETSQPLVAYANQLKSEVDSLKKEFGQFTSTLQTAQQQYAAKEEAEALAGRWATSGLTDIDMAGAQALVGKPMTVQQAMQVANLDRLLKHTHTVTLASAGKAVPNEPGGLNASGGTIKGDGMPFGQYMEQRAFELQRK